MHARGFFVFPAVLTTVVALAGSAPAQTRQAVVHLLPQTDPIGRDTHAINITLHRQTFNNDTEMRGYYSTNGKSYAASGSLRSFTFTRNTNGEFLPGTLPPPTFSPRIHDDKYHLNFAKFQGPQSILLDETDLTPTSGVGFLYVGSTGVFVPREGDPRLVAGAPLGRLVSTLAIAHTNPPTSPVEFFPIPTTDMDVGDVSHVRTDGIFPPGRTGRGPEGMALLSKQHLRCAMVNNYHEGTVSAIAIDPEDPLAVGPFLGCEFPIDLDNDDQSLGSFPDPEGNLNRPLAMWPTPTDPSAWLLAGLKFDEADVATYGPMGKDGFPDEGPFDYLVIVDLTNVVTSQDCATAPRIAVPLGPSNQATIASIAVHPGALSGQPYVYVASSDFGIDFQDRSEDPHLYAVNMDNLSVTAAINLPAQYPGLPNTSASEMLAIRNPNLPQWQDRLYIGTRNTGGGNDGHIAVFDITTNPAAPTLLDDFDLSPFDNPALTTNTSYNVRGMVAVPVDATFLGNDMARNVIFALGDDGDGSGQQPDLQDRFIIFEDR